MTTPLSEPSTQITQHTTFVGTIWNAERKFFVMPLRVNANHFATRAYAVGTIENEMYTQPDVAYDETDAVYNQLRPAMQLLHDGASEAEVPILGWVCQVHEVTVKIVVDRKLG